MERKESEREKEPLCLGSSEGQTGAQDTSGFVQPRREGLRLFSLAVLHHGPRAGGRISVVQS